MEITLTDNLPNIRAKLRSALSKAVNTSALDLEATAKQKIQNSPATGEMYGKHQSSAPGEAPATDKGTLVNSIESKSIDELHSVVNVSAEYAAYLEYGTTTMEPRPFLAPSLAEVKPRFEARAREAMKNAK